MYITTVCVGCPSGWVCRVHVWGRCVAGHPGWNSCCTRVTDPVCAAANLACTGLKRGLEAAIVVAQRVVQGAKRSLDAANLVLEGAKHVVNGAKHTLNVANAVLEGVKRAYRAGIQAISAIVRVGLGGLVQVREIYFSTSLRDANQGRFHCRVRVSFLGRHPVTLGMHIDIRNPWGMAKQLASRIIPGVAMQAEWKSPWQLK